MPESSRSLAFVVSASVFMGAASLTGCSGNEPDRNEPDRVEVTASSPTFHKDVEPILQRSCMGCHSTGNIAPFSLTSYEQVKPIASLIASTTRAGTMPPFAVRNTDECTTRLGWKGDIQLSDEELDTLEAWSKAGAPEGDSKDAPSAFVPESPDLPGMNLEIQAKTPYVTAGDKDEFRCFVMDLGLTEDQYLNGLHMVPGNPKVVHHALIFIDPLRESETRMGPDGSYPCAQGDLMGRRPLTQLVDAWAPGADPIDLPAGVGYLIPKGSLMVMQIHYHPAGVTADPDTSRIQLRLNKEKPKYGFEYRLFGNFPNAVGELGVGLLPGPDDTDGVEFRIPADSASHVETEQVTIAAPDAAVPGIFKVPAGTRIYGEFLHMHYLGFEQKVTVTRPGAGADQPAEECLAHAPHWDFSWQRAYAYDAPFESLPTLEAGDVLRIRCTYNNTTDNPYVQRALQEAHLPSTTDVTYGEGNTLDEMCNTGLSLVYPMP
jgi:hypothetical protein